MTGRVAVLAAVGAALAAAQGKTDAQLWVLKPVVRPATPAGLTKSVNPIDAFLAADYHAKGLRPSGPADKQTLLRRVYLDLEGLPPSPAEQDAFLKDTSPDAYEKVVDRLLASDQHGVRYARHWLDVLRYADVDERMIAAPGIYLWRDWMIRALNDDVPYDQFVRAQLTGYRTRERTTISATGVRSKLEPRPDDMFALGFLSRSDVIRDGKETQELALMAAETVSTAFMGLTAGCAKCHDHRYDPIKQIDFYAMKALFDPLVLRKVMLATPEQLFAGGKAQEAAARERQPAEAELEAFVAPIRTRLYNDRLLMLPADAQAVIRKPERQRTVQEQKIADDYFPVLRIDSDKIQEVLTPDQLKEYKNLQAKVTQATRRAGTPPAIPAFWTVEADPKKELDTSYILTSGDPDRPEKDHPVKPGWPFAPADIDFRDGRIAAFSDWLTAPENPMFARVAVNRLWQWHFGEGLEKSSSDFGNLGGLPSDAKLLDWLASEFTTRHFSMKEMHRLMVTSDAYKRSSEAETATAAANEKADPGDAYLWHFRLQRLDAEPVWDSIMTAAGTLDLKVGGASFDVSGNGGGRRGGAAATSAPATPGTYRRAAYMIRGFSTSRDVVPSFLQVFDVDDGRAPCPLRTQTVTAPQGLFLMNSDEVAKASLKMAERLEKESQGDLTQAVDLGFRTALARPPKPAEKDSALTYLQNDPARLKGFAWLLFNLDEFIYVR